MVHRARFPLWIVLCSLIAGAVERPQAHAAAPARTPARPRVARTSPVAPGEAEPPGPPPGPEHAESAARRFVPRMPRWVRDAAALEPLFAVERVAPDLRTGAEPDPVGELGLRFHLGGRTHLHLTLDRGPCDPLSLERSEELSPAVALRAVWSF